MQKAKQKQYDGKKTMSEALKCNGTPLRLYYQTPSIKKYKLFCLFDISGSVSHYLEVLISFLFELNCVFNGGIAIYGFVDTAIDFTPVFKEKERLEVVSHLTGHRGYSHYGKAITEFYEAVYNQVDGHTLLLYFGDARNNRNASGETYLRKLNQKAQCSVWLNPEAKEAWNTGDSLAKTYSACTSQTYEVHQVGQLIHFLEHFDFRKSSGNPR